MADRSETSQNDQAAAAARLLQLLAEGYYAHDAAMLLARHPRAWELAPQIEPGQIVPIGRVRDSTSEGHHYDFRHYLAEIQRNPSMSLQMERTWLYGALLLAGDELGKARYFDRAPELELIRHMRNGIAHGNRFRIDNPSSLIDWPAHNRGYALSTSMRQIELTPQDNGREVLFGFMEAGDVVTLLQFSAAYLNQLAAGLPPRSFLPGYG